MQRKLKNDRYRKSRGGYSRLLDISCRECAKNVCFYQKDGPGNLRRMYIDRITFGKFIVRGEKFHCPSAHLLGIKTLYKKENRPAVRLFVDAVLKKVTRII